MDIREQLSNIVDGQTTPKFFQVFNATVDPLYAVHNMSEFDEVFEDWKPSQIVNKLSNRFNSKDKYFCIWKRDGRIVSFSSNDDVEYPVGDEEWENMLDVLLIDKPETGVKRVDAILARV